MQDLMPLVFMICIVVALHAVLRFYFIFRAKRSKVVPGVFYQVRYNPFLDRFTINDVPMDKSQVYEVMIPACDDSPTVFEVRPVLSFVFGWYFVYASNSVRLPFRPVGLFCRIPPVPEFDENGEELGGGYEF